MKMEWLRSLPRPVLALIAGGGTLAFILLDKAIPEGWWAFVGSVLVFYFTQRHEEKKP